MDRKQVKLADQSDNAYKPNGSFKEIYRTAFSFLANPCNLWASDKLEDKRTVAKLVCADSLKYKRNEGYRTAKTSSMLSMLEDLNVGKSEMARSDVKCTNELFQTLEDWEHQLKHLVFFWDAVEETADREEPQS